MQELSLKPVFLQNGKINDEYIWATCATGTKAKFDSIDMQNSNIGFSFSLNKPFFLS